MKISWLLVLSAMGLCVVSVVVTEALEPPRHHATATAPLTELAGKAPVVDVRPEEAPHQAPNPLRAQPPRNTPERLATSVSDDVSPSLMPDPTHPPQWTQPLAVPSPPSPPDPFEPPPVFVDPTRGRQTHVE